MATTAFLALLQGQMIAAALGRPVDIATFLTALIGVFLAIIGNVMGKLRWNYVAGFRTPWTLADERVWDKTHRFGGWLLVIGGLVLAASAFAPAHPPVKLFLILGVVATVAGATLVKSYLLWRKRDRAERDRNV
ncbi:MAG: SdpI family protein [Caulobacteraceae bacterium]